MKQDQKQFAIDLLKALDLAIHGKLRSEEEYNFDLIGISRKEIITVIKYLSKKGYKKCSQ